jgi:hypothetical protein
MHPFDQAALLKADRVGKEAGMHLQHISAKQIQSCTTFNPEADVMESFQRVRLLRQDYLEKRNAWAT